MSQSHERRRDFGIENVPIGRSLQRMRFELVSIEDKTWVRWKRKYSRLFTDSCFLLHVDGNLQIHFPCSGQFNDHGGQSHGSRLFAPFISQRRASASPSSTAVASTVNQRNVPQTKSGQFGVPQRINLPKESVNVRSSPIQSM